MTRRAYCSFFFFFIWQYDAALGVPHLLAREPAEIAEGKRRGARPGKSLPAGLIPHGPGRRTHREKPARRTHPPKVRPAQLGEARCAAKEAAIAERKRTPRTAPMERVIATG